MALWTRHVSIVLSVILMSGCYNYVRMDAALLPVGQDVRLLVTPAGAEEFSSYTSGGDGLAPVIQGTLARRDGDALFIRVPVGNRVGDNPRAVDLRQMVRVPVDGILATERKELDPGKTAFLIAGAGAFGSLIFFKIISNNGGIKGQTDVEPDFHLGGFRIPIG